MKKIRSKRLVCPVGKQELREIEDSDHPQQAASIVAGHSIEDAVRIIDNLDPLVAAFVIAMFKLRAQGGTTWATCSKTYARKVVARANVRRIRGTLGLCYARDEVYHKTGILVGT